MTLKIGLGVVQEYGAVRHTIYDLLLLGHYLILSYIL